MVIEAFEWSEPKTARAVEVLTAMGAPGKTLVVLGAGDGIAERSMRNLPLVNTLGAGQLNTYDVLWADTVVFTKETVSLASGRAAFDVADDDFVREDGEGDES